MDTMTRVQILDKADCISHSTNTLGKGMNPIILPQAMGKLTTQFLSATKVFSFQLATRYFLLLGFCPLFSLSYIKVTLFLISMCHDPLVNWPVNLSLISYFRKPTSSLSIFLLATWASVLLTKNLFVTFQSTDDATQLDSLALVRQPV